ncbi:hypothetical protein [Pseudoxanthomonas koreensis]|uniref:hypothetical protein n=1 Tax=Pseudoxanthomonas koreensis TaxID=266061 RepID=UPI001391C0F9|nr:hypothetical protein [Pseudoxanthomonas koreensis]
MNTAAHLSQLQALHAPRAADLLRPLVDIGDGLAAAFATLHRDPHPAAAEQLAIRLEGARRHVLKLADALRKEGV